MGSWAAFEAEAPELAARVRERFGIRKHKTMATLRRDGSPRISGIECEFEEGELRFGVMPASAKLRDLRRDPRVALHSPTDDPPDGSPASWRGEAKVAGRAVEEPFEAPPVPGAARFRVDLVEVVHTHLNAAGDRLVVDSWHAARGLQSLERE